MTVTPEILLYITSASVVVSIISLIFLIRAETRLKNFLRGSKAVTLEDSINNITHELQDLSFFRADLEKYLETVEVRLKKSIQGISTLRFNPYKGTGGGGNQSFATAFLNEKGDGVIFSSLYSRDHVSIFSKPIVNFKSEFELSVEEQESLNKAKELTQNL